MTPEEIIGLLALTTPDLTPRLGTFGPGKSDGGQLNAQFNFVTFRDGQVTIGDLINVAHGRMVNFAMPRSRIAEAIAEMQKSLPCMDAYVSLVTEARDLFMQTDTASGRSGELGELLLYMLVEWKLKAPIVACKMYLKTSQQMPVHGVDGIHLGFEEDKIVIYWGESKLHKGFASALDDILVSIKSSLSNPQRRQNEVRIVRSNLNIDNLNEEARASLRDFFDPYKPQSNNVIDKFVCLAGFDYPIYQSAAAAGQKESESEFLKAYAKRVEECWDLIKGKHKDSGLQGIRFIYFLLPLPSVEDARRAFQDKLWGKS